MLSPMHTVGCIFIVFVMLGFELRVPCVLGESFTMEPPQRVMWPLMLSALSSALNMTTSAGLWPCVWKEATTPDWLCLAASASVLCI